jgi:hypothetical protein
MNLKQYILALTIGTLIACTAWIVVLLNIDPLTSGWSAFAIFYLTFFIASTGLITTISTLIRTLFLKPKHTTDHHISTSLRHGVLIGILVLSTLILLHEDILSWWVLLLSILAVSLIEFLALSLKTPEEST